MEHFYVYPALWNGLSSKSWPISEGTLLKKHFHKGALPAVGRDKENGADNE
jgi:hypothetical protein